MVTELQSLLFSHAFRKLPEEVLHRSLVAERPRLPASRLHRTSQVLGVPGSRYLNPRSMKRTVSSLSGEPAAGTGQRLRRTFLKGESVAPPVTPTGGVPQGTDRAEKKRQLTQRKEVSALSSKGRVKFVRSSFGHSW